MKRIVLMLAAIGVVAVPLAASADTYRKGNSRQAETRAADTRRVYDDRDRFGWYPHDVNRLKVGSQIWWEQMEREGRLGGFRKTR